jgi:hypothetical protein
MLLWLVVASFFLHGSLMLKKGDTPLISDDLDDKLKEIFRRIQTLILGLTNS